MNYNMNQATGAIQHALSNLLSDICNNNFYNYDDPKVFELPTFKNFFVFVKKLAIEESEGNPRNYYAISVRTPKLPVAIDILDVVHLYDGIQYRFEGVTVTAVVFPNLAYIDGSGAERLIRMIINSNRELAKVIQEHNLGASDELKKPGK